MPEGEWRGERCAFFNIPVQPESFRYFTCNLASLEIWLTNPRGPFIHSLVLFFVQAASCYHRNSLLGWCCPSGVPQSFLTCEAALPRRRPPGRAVRLRPSPGGLGQAVGAACTVGSPCLWLMAEWQRCSYIIGFSPPLSFQSQISH